MKSPSLNYAYITAKATESELANRALEKHFRNCEKCRTAPFGFCDVALKLITDVPKVDRN